MQVSVARLSPGRQKPTKAPVNPAILEKRRYNRFKHDGVAMKMLIEKTRQEGVNKKVGPILTDLIQIVPTVKSKR